MSLQHKYIYGIIEEPQHKRFSVSGIGEAEVYTLNCQKLAAVVSDVDLSEIDPTRKNVFAHTVVQDKLLRDYTLLPMGFGMIAGSEDEVLGLLDTNYQGLTLELARLAGKIEVELRVFWDEATMIKKLQNESAELTNLKAKISAASSPIEAHNLLIEAGKLVEHVALDWQMKYAEQVYIILRGLSIEAQRNDPQGVKNILNASFLVDCSRESEFQQKVYQLNAQYQGNINFKYVGPLAPYSFVNLKLEMIHGHQVTL